MPESSQEWYDRVSARIAESGYRRLGWSRWETWPFEGELVPKDLQPPGPERPRAGAGGVDCFMCEAAAGHGGDYLVWTDEVLMIGVPQELIAIPVHGLPDALCPPRPGRPAGRGRPPDG